MWRNFLKLRHLVDLDWLTKQLADLFGGFGPSLSSQGKKKNKKMDGS